MWCQMFNSGDIVKQSVLVSWVFVFVGLLFIILWWIGIKFVLHISCFCHLDETVVEGIVFMLVENLWLPRIILPMYFKYCQNIGWWPHYNHFVTIQGQGWYHLGKLVRVQSNKNPFWKQSCWLVWFVRYWSLCCYSLVTKLLFDQWRLNGLSDDYLVCFTGLLFDRSLVVLWLGDCCHKVANFRSFKNLCWTSFSWSVWPFIDSFET